MGMHFGQYPNLADGIFLRTWRGGPQKNEPKVPAAVRTMMDRGLVEIRNTERGPRAFFTEAGQWPKSDGWTRHRSAIGGCRSLGLAS